MYECTNCEWKGKELSVEPLKDKCPVCGDSVSGLAEEIVVDKKEEPIVVKKSTKGLNNSKRK